jgi:predicted nucleic acid-binding protein
MIVVADTSVILNLCRMQHEYLLQRLYNRVLIPVPVAGEFTRLSKTHSRFSGLALPHWIEILPAPKSFPAEVIQAQLDVGESAAIALCLEQKADALLVDELLGREVATRLRVRTIGILGILMDARNQKLISSVKVLLERLEKEANFWIAPNLKNRVLQLAGE